jgi:dTDP-D-glucose 4,6-dehydratase
MVAFHASRPGHDMRYALDGSYLAKKAIRFPSLSKKVCGKSSRWTMDHPRMALKKNVLFRVERGCPMWRLHSAPNRFR